MPPSATRRTRAGSPARPRARSRRIWPFTGRTGRPVRRGRPAAGGDHHVTARPHRTDVATGCGTSTARPAAAVRSAGTTRRGSTWWSAGASAPPRTRGESAGSRSRSSLGRSGVTGRPSPCWYAQQPARLGQVVAGQPDQQGALGPVADRAGRRGQLGGERRPAGGGRQQQPGQLPLTEIRLGDRREHAGGHRRRPEPGVRIVHGHAAARARRSARRSPARSAPPPPLRRPAGPGHSIGADSDRPVSTSGPRSARRSPAPGRPRRRPHRRPPPRTPRRPAAPAPARRSPRRSR